MDIQDGAPSSVSSLDKGLGLLAAIIADDGKTSLAGLAARIGVPQSTARRLAASLERHRLVARLGRGHYVAGGGLLAAGGSGRHDDLLTRVARLPLRRLARSTGSTAHLGVLESEMVTYLVKEHGGGGALFTREGQQLEAYCSAVGKVLLASLPPAACDAYLAAGGFVALTARTIVDVATLRDELDRVRRLGFATDDEEVADGLYCIAAPVCDGTGTVIAAISISGSAAMLRVRTSGDLRDALGVCAAAIERRL